MLNVIFLILTHFYNKRKKDTIYKEFPKTDNMKD